jgi:hypothetical protein
MTRSAFFTVLVFALVANGAPAAPAPMQSGTAPTRGLPDFSGLDLVNSFVRLPEARTSLATLCEVRRSAIDEALRTAAESLASAQAQADPVKVARVHNATGQILFYKGDVDGAIARFEEGYRIASAGAGSNPALATTALHGLAALGVAHMRRGELQNCAHHHTADMCIFPLSAAARHTERSGSERAIEYFEQYLAHNPSSLEVRWLLNVAHQTLGSYPDKVPKAFLIPPSAFESKADVGRFVDIAPALGLDLVGSAGAGVVDDFDNDGYLDIVETGVDPCQPMRMFRNKGDGTFEDVSARSRLSEQLGGINAIQTDYDNDGWLDLFVMRGGWEFAMRNSLLRNNRDGSFTDVTAESGLLSAEHRTHSAVWADYDNDGWVDVFVGHEHTPSQLFRNKGDGTFEDVSAKAGVDKTAYTKGATWGDYDNDGFADLYVSNFMGDNFLFRNKGDGTFEEVAKQLGVEKPWRSFPTWFFDYDNDGWLDLFVASYSFVEGEWVRSYLGLPPGEEAMKLYRNTGKGGFEDVTKAVGLERGVAAMGANYGDLDNDGYLDFYLGTGTPSYSALMPNLMYWNRGGREFVDVTTSTGTGHLQKGHGIAFADLDNDGNEDIYTNMGGAVLGDKYNKALFENPGHGNNWISIRLVGAKSNRAGIGAKVKLTLAGKGGVRYREVTSGGSFGSSPLMQHIGMGGATRVASLEVTWPTSRTRQVFKDVAANQFVEIKESEKTFQARRVPELTFKRRPAPSPHTGHR